MFCRSTTIVYPGAKYKYAIIQTLVPLFGVIFSAIFLQEKFDVFIYPFALLLVILGISLVNLKSSHNEGEGGKFSKNE